MYMVKKCLKKDTLPIKKKVFVMSFAMDKGIMEALEDHT
jgi:hypothetical protein